ncbi:MAG: NAD-dependent epimerase/dehydratase family protein [Hyphomicrobiaceae bacterium]
MKVLVTGAGGHLGFNLVGGLVAAGHEVRGSLRSLAAPKAVERLQGQGACDVVAAPLEDERLLRAAMDGMDVLIHTAAVYLLHAPGRETEIVAASVEGVERAFRAAMDARIKRIVLTSSIVALPLTRAGSRPVDESAWNEDLRVPYFRAKTLAERRAWELARELGLDLVTVLPGAFGGPGFSRPTPTIDLVAAIMKGAMRVAVPPIAYPYVDVRDVASAHVMALMSGATGRFIAINEPIPMIGDIAREMSRLDPSVPKPLMTLPGFTMSVLPYLEVLVSALGGTSRTMTPAMAATMRTGRYNLTSARLRRELGWAPAITLAQSLEDTMAAIRQHDADKLRVHAKIEAS